MIYIVISIEYQYEIIWVEASRRCALPTAAKTEKEGTRGDELVPLMIHNVTKEENVL